LTTTSANANGLDAVNNVCLDEKLLNKWRVDDEKREETIELNLSKCDTAKMRTVAHIMPEQLTLTHLNANTFNEMFKLKKLNFANNALNVTSFSPNVFAPLRGLECLILTNNKLTCVDDNLLNVCNNFSKF
jgi:hypothetical protein